MSRRRFVSTSKHPYLLVVLKMISTDDLPMHPGSVLRKSQYKGGHPGTVMGAAAIGIALWRYEMRYNPSNPDWFNRDREYSRRFLLRKVTEYHSPNGSGFVMSAGHACLFQYIFLHFAGYEAWTLGQIKMYHSPATSGSMAAGHPEIEYPG